MATAMIKSEVLDELLMVRGCKTVFELDGLLDELKKALDDVTAWWGRPLEAVYAIVFFDWLRVMTEFKNRGVCDVLIAVVDGLKGFPEATSSVFPLALVQTCIVHQIRYSMQFASWKERKALVAALKPIYRAENAAAKLMWLVLRNVEAQWKNPPIYWQVAKVQMALQFEERFVVN